MMLNVIVSPFFVAFIACYSGYVNEAEEAKEEATPFLFFIFFFWSKREFKTTLIEIGKDCWGNWNFSGSSVTHVSYGELINNQKYCVL